MKIINYLFFLLLLVSCEKKTQEMNSNISLIDRNAMDSNLELVNGILLFKRVPYSGIVKEYYSENKIKSTSVYLKGKREGYYRGWYINGSKSFEREYKKGFKSGVHLGWYDTGEKKFEYHFNEKGIYNGTVKEWYINGMKMRFFNYADGREEGSQKIWQSNGKIRANFVTKNGERFGLIGLKKCYSVNTTNEEIK